MCNGYTIAELISNPSDLDYLADEAFPVPELIPQHEIDRLDESINLCEKMRREL